jgi:hypothetical protein
LRLHKWVVRDVYFESVAGSCVRIEHVIRWIPLTPEQVARIEQQS